MGVPGGLTCRQAISWAVPFFEGGVWGGVRALRAKKAPEGEQVCFNFMVAVTLE